MGYTLLAVYEGTKQATKPLAATRMNSAKIAHSSSENAYLLLPLDER